MWGVLGHHLQRCVCYVYLKPDFPERLQKTQEWFVLLPQYRGCWISFIVVHEACDRFKIFSLSPRAPLKPVSSTGRTDCPPCPKQKQGSKPAACPDGSKASGAWWESGSVNCKNAICWGGAESRGPGKGWRQNLPLFPWHAAVKGKSLGFRAHPSLALSQRICPSPWKLPC